MKIKINSDIFRAYDIRGIYPSTINAKVAYLIGRAFVKFLKKSRPNIVVGQDVRLSGPKLFKGLTRGIIKQGGNVINIGLSTTPMLYFAVAHFKFDGGINITASHLSSEHNGFKVVRKKAIPLSQKTGLKEIQKLTTKAGNLTTKPGKVVKKNVLEDYLKFNFEKFNLKNFRKLKIIVDTANAVPGILIPELKKKLPVQIYSLFEKLDGNFPNHQPDPLIKENLQFLQQEVKKKKANLGLAFDGDGDRIIFVDEKGEVIPADLITAFLAKLILEQNPGAKILYDIRSSRAVEEIIKENSGQPVVWKIGHSFIKEKMRKENIFFAGEFSGHYYRKDQYFSEAPLFILLKILEEISRSKKTFSELIKPYQKYFHSGEINFKVAPIRKSLISNGARGKKKVLETLEDKFKKGKISKVDGLRVDFPGWWFLVRPSNTEPIIRLVVEAKTKKLLRDKTHLLSNLLNG